MTPKEKAQELFNKFNKPDITHYPYVHNAQQCALIAVNEIIKACPLEPSNPYSYYICEQEAMEFWTEVKNEIEIL
jgi:hypothetical protein